MKTKPLLHVIAAAALIVPAHFANAYNRSSYETFGQLNNRLANTVGFDKVHTGLNQNGKPCQIFSYRSYEIFSDIVHGKFPRIFVKFDGTLTQHPHPSEYSSMYALESVDTFKKSLLSRDEAFVYSYNSFFDKLQDTVNPLATVDWKEKKVTEKVSFNADGTLSISRAGTDKFNKFGKCTVDPRNGVTLEASKIAVETKYENEPVREIQYQQIEASPFVKFTKIPVVVAWGQTFNLEVEFQMGQAEEQLRAFDYQLITPRGQKLDHNEVAGREDGVLFYKWDMNRGNTMLSKEVTETHKIQELGGGRYRVSFKVLVPKHELYGFGAWTVKVAPLRAGTERNSYFQPFEPKSRDRQSVLFVEQAQFQVVP